MNPLSTGLHETLRHGDDNAGSGDSSSRSHTLLPAPSVVGLGVTSQKFMEGRIGVPRQGIIVGRPHQRHLVTSHHWTLPTPPIPPPLLVGGVVVHVLPKVVLGHGGTDVSGTVGGLHTSIVPCRSMVSP